MKPAREDDIPKTTHEGVLDILGEKVKVHHLDDGSMVIEKDDMERLLRKLFGETQ